MCSDSFGIEDHEKMINSAKQGCRMICSFLFWVANISTTDFIDDLQYEALVQPIGYMKIGLVRY